MITITVSATGDASQSVSGVTTGLRSGCERDPICGFGGPIEATTSLVMLVKSDGGTTDAATDAPADATQG